MKQVGLKWFILGKSLASVNIKSKMHFCLFNYWSYKHEQIFYKFLLGICFSDTFDKNVNFDVKRHISYQINEFSLKSTF